MAMGNWEWLEWHTRIPLGTRIASGAKPKGGPVFTWANREGLWAPEREESETSDRPLY